MSLESYRDGMVKHSPPRASGDEPAVELGSTAPAESAPRERG